MPFTIVREDITHMQVDAIVNAANIALQMGGGVCGAIFRAAGAERLQAACDPLAPIPTGGAVVTPGFDLPAQYIIHAAGPVYSRWHPKRSRRLLYSAYTQALRLAEERGCKSIAFPLISSGIYGYPKAEAVEVAREAVGEYLRFHDMEVYLAVFDRASFAVSRILLGAVESYIDEHYVQTSSFPQRQLLEVERAAFWERRRGPKDEDIAPKEALPEMPLPMAAASPPCRGSLEEWIEHLDEPFSATLLKLIDSKGKTDAEVYKKANIDRKLFSKIRTGKGYTPRKPTILALAISLELTLSETEQLLERAGYALSHASKFDVIVEYFIINRRYNIFEINEVLFSYDQPLLGS